jgi:hypothetical protein
LVSLSADSSGLLVRPELARAQIDADTANATPGGPTTGSESGGEGATGPVAGAGREKAQGPTPPTRFHGTVNLDPSRVGRDSSRIAEEVIAHLVGLVGSTVTVTLEIEADIPAGAPDNVVRTVTENSRTLRFTQQGFERD